MIWHKIESRRRILRERTYDRVHEYSRQFREAREVLQGQADLLNRDSIVNAGNRSVPGCQVVLYTRLLGPGAVHVPSTYQCRDAFRNTATPESVIYEMLWASPVRHEWTPHVFEETGTPIRLVLACDLVGVEAFSTPADQGISGKVGTAHEETANNRIGGGGRAATVFQRGLRRRL